MEERIGLVFSWDPRAQHWVKERGPDDAPPPPADPIDHEAVQTYFLDPQTGRWNGTILGLKARQMSVELGAKYRNPRMVGLAIIAKAAPKSSLVPTPDQKKSNAVPMMAGLAAVVVVIAAGAFAAQAVMKPKDAAAASPTASAVLGTTPAPDATAAPTDAPAQTAAPTDAPVQTPARTAPPRTVAPTQPPAPALVTYSTRLPNGTTVIYRGPNSVPQNTALDGNLTIVGSSGAAYTDQVTIYIGQLGVAGTLTFNPDSNGNLFFSIKASTPKGGQPLSVSLGRNGEIRALGTITVR